MKNKELVVVGINDSHNASACVFVGGTLIAAAAEERFQRIKSMGGFPKNAIEECMKIAGVTKRNVDYVAVGSIGVSADNMHNIVPTLGIRDLYRLEKEYWQPVIYEKKNKRLRDIFPHYKPKGVLHYPLKSVPFAFNRELSPATVERIAEMRKKFAARYFGLPEDSVHFVDHHTAHAYYAYWTDPLREKKRNVLVLTADAGGDGVYESVNVFSDGAFKCIYRGHTCLVAPIYSYMTLLLGMKPNEHEYKVMGLAPYAKEYEKKGPRGVFEDALAVHGLKFRRSPEVKDLFKYFQEKLLRYRFDGIAGGLQDFAEDIIRTWVLNTIKATGIGDLALSGGLFLNIKINKVLSELQSVRSLYVPPGIGDESLAIGACYRLFEDLGKDMFKVTPLWHAYLGSVATKKDVEKLLRHPLIKRHYSIKRKATPDDVARVLARGEICAIFQGAMEFGPRALGHRSIIADPSKPESVKKINDAIKMRDFWMPFTPSILSERMNDYIVTRNGISDSYMTVSFDTTKLGRSHLAAAIHPYDKTARPQRVRKSVAPEYYSIIKAFEKRTGIGAVLNTSLNIHGKPIVRRPIEIARELIANADVRLDNIYIEGILLSRKRRT